MRLFKLLIVIFGVYFIRRFIQMYRVMKRIQEQQQAQAQNHQASGAPHKQPSAIDAEYRVVD